MSAEVRQSGDSFADLLKMLDAVGRGRTRQKALGALARECNAITREAFDNERSPAGEPWKALKKPRHGRKILDRTGKLRGQATRVMLSGTSLAFGVLVYGPFHQAGTTHMPARPFVPWDPLSAEVQMRLERAIASVLEP